MKRFRYAIFLLIFFIGSYAFWINATRQPIKPASGVSQIACPSREFSEFIKAFSENTEVQKAFTKYPHQYQFLDTNAEPEPMPVMQRLRRDQVTFPVMPNEAERKKKSLEVSVDSVSGSQAKATLFKPDTDWQVLYFFSLHSCWHLERIEDWSL